jgi:O-antigen/teichoic acid export membrane protein
MSEQLDPAAVGEPPAAPSQRGSKTFRLVARNTAFLALAHVLSVPLAITLNAVTARYLGPAALGYLYVATTFNSFAFLAVDWGGHGALPALVATDRSRAGKLLGTALAWRGAMSFAAYAALAVFCYVLRYPVELQIAVALVAFGYALSSLTNACQAVITGFERTDVSAKRQVVEEMGRLVFVSPILLLGGNLNFALLGHALAVVAAFAYVSTTVRPVGITTLAVDRGVLKTLLAQGTPFVFLSLVMVLQPYIDALFLSKLVPPDVVGWHAAAQKLVGVLVFPAAALIGALYPTLCRLHATDPEGFRRATSGALRGTGALVLPIALGCALFPDIGISIYSRDRFGAAENNLRIMSLYIAILYFTMPLGISLIAAGKQRVWAIVLTLCVLVSVLLDPLFVPWFQERYGNGGLGVNTANVVSEVLILTCAVVLTPRGVFDRRFFRTAFSAVLGGVVMAGCARALQSFSSFAVAPAAVAAYALVFWFSGGVDKEHLAIVSAAIRRRISRA